MFMLNVFSTILYLNDTPTIKTGRKLINYPQINENLSINTTGKNLQNNQIFNWKILILILTITSAPFCLLYLWVWFYQLITNFSILQFSLQNYWAIQFIQKWQRKRKVSLVGSISHLYFGFWYQNKFLMVSLTCHLIIYSLLP